MGAPTKAWILPLPWRTQASVKALGWCQRACTFDRRPAPAPPSRASAKRLGGRLSPHGCSPAPQRRPLRWQPALWVLAWLRRRRAAASLALMAGLTPALTCQAVEPAGTWVKLVAFNDFHGQLESLAACAPTPPAHTQPACGRRGLDGRLCSQSQSTKPAHSGGVGRRHHRRHAFGVGTVPRRTYHRSHEPLRPGF